MASPRLEKGIDLLVFEPFCFVRACVPYAFGVGLVQGAQESQLQPQSIQPEVEDDRQEAGETLSHSIVTPLTAMRMLPQFDGSPESFPSKSKSGVGADYSNGGEGWFHKTLHGIPFPISTRYVRYSPSHHATPRCVDHSSFGYEKTRFCAFVRVYSFHEFFIMQRIDQHSLMYVVLL